MTYIRTLHVLTPTTQHVVAIRAGYQPLFAVVVPAAIIAQHGATSSTISIALVDDMLLLLLLLFVKIKVEVVVVAVHCNANTRCVCFLCAVFFLSCVALVL